MSRQQRRCWSLEDLDWLILWARSCIRGSAMLRSAVTVMSVLVLFSEIVLRKTVPRSKKRNPLLRQLGWR